MNKTCSRGHVFEKTSACPTCPTCWPKLKRTLLAKSDLPSGLGAPALRALDHEGIRTLAALAKRTEAWVADLHGMGPKALAILRSALHARKLRFRK